MIYDTMMGHNEADMLECRLRELERIPDLMHVVVEADVDHQGHPKPYYLSEQWSRFDQWRERLTFVRASRLPTVEEDPDPWSREHAQREWVTRALIHADPDDIVLHGDIDEIPTAAWAANVRPQGFAIAGQRFHPFAVDWLHPHIWPGTVAAKVRDIKSFAAMRDVRLRGYEPGCPLLIPGSGWHFTWVGGNDYQRSKLGTFCHPEVAAWSQDLIDRGDLWRHGYHVDGQRLEAVEVDGTWPRWIRDRQCPPDWFRPEGERAELQIRAGAIVGTNR